MFKGVKSRLQKKKGLTYNELDEINKRNEKYVKRPSTRKRKPKNIWIRSAF